MTSPTDPTAMLSQILLKQGEMGIQLAVISEQLKPVADHETRIRQLEQFRWRLAGVAAACGVGAGAISTFGGYLIAHVR